MTIALFCIGRRARRISWISCARADVAKLATHRFVREAYAAKGCRHDHTDWREQLVSSLATDVVTQADGAASRATEPWRADAATVRPRLRPDGEGELHAQRLGPPGPAAAAAIVALLCLFGGSSVLIFSANDLAGARSEQGRVAGQGSAGAVPALVPFRRGVGAPAVLDPVGDDPRRLRRGRAQAADEPGPEHAAQCGCAGDRPARRSGRAAGRAPLAFAQRPLEGGGRGQVSPFARR